jgi:hypothetical protein
MKMPAVGLPYLLAGGAVLAALAYVSTKGAKGAGEQLGGAAVDLVNGIVSGSVVSAGALVGIPATNETECEKAKREGRTWDASFACPAKDFISYVWN